MRAALVLFCVLACTSCTLAGAWSDIILPPAAGKQGTPVAMIFAQGASIPTSRYTPILQALQQEFSYPLWVGIPQCLTDACAVPGTLASGVSRITSAMQAKGMASGTKVFYGGHSLGGAMIPPYVNNTADKSTAVGLVLMGAFLTRSFKTSTTAAGRPQYYNAVPTLTIGGELDGLCRVSRIAESLYSQVTFAADPAAAVHRLPVTVVEGMNHMQFASGPPPLLVKERDLRPEISEAKAHSAVAADAAAFMTAVLQGSGSSSWSQVETRVKQSTAFVQPLVDALLMEGYQNFLPACYCESKDEYGGLEYGTCADTPSCKGGSPWTQQMSQAIMGGVGVLAGLSINTHDSLHHVTEVSPSVHLPHIHKSQYKANTDPNANPGNGKAPALCAKGQPCSLDISTITENIYTLASQDTGFFPIAATEMRVKMKSRQAVWEAAGVSDVNFTASDSAGANLCQQINQASLDWAVKHVGAATLARFNSVGQTVQMAPDNGTCAAGPCWIYDKLHWSNEASRGVVTVSSVTFATDNKNSLPCREDKLPFPPCMAGFHYCKVLSPAQVMEWMYVDGLRLKYSMNSTA